MDKLEEVGGALVQHGHFNDRIYLMKLKRAEPGGIAQRLIDLAEEKGYSKIFAKVPKPSSKPFLDRGYQLEAFIPRFFSGRASGCFLAHYLDDERSAPADQNRLEEVLDIARARKLPATAKPPALEPKFKLRGCGEDDAGEMAGIYREVFPTYPFPIHDPDYLVQTMRDNVDYFCIEREGRLVALSSAETDSAASNVEMTDFATLPHYRGNGFGIHLLKRMDSAMKKKRLKTAYTIARAISPGMNVTFARGGYDFGGRLVNNTNISGGIESMNVWYRPLLSGREA